MSTQSLRTIVFGREVQIAYLALVGLYLARLSGVQALQIPAYLLIVTYDFIEVVLPGLTPYYPVVFPVYLLVLAVIAGGIARWVTANTRNIGIGRGSISGVCLIVGTISLVFGVLVGGPLVAPADNPTPSAITLSTGIVFLFAAWWIAGTPGWNTASHDDH